MRSSNIIGLVDLKVVLVVVIHGKSVRSMKLAQRGNWVLEVICYWDLSGVGSRAKGVWRLRVWARA